MSTTYLLAIEPSFSCSEATMSDTRHADPAKVQFLRNLPEAIKATITGEEAHEFMFGEYIPESLYEKIKDLLEAEPDDQS